MHKGIYAKGGALSLCLIVLYAQAAVAQVGYRIQHQAPTVVNRNSPATLLFEVPGISSGEIQDAFLFYKYDGEMSYQQRRADFNLADFSVSVPIENENASTLEYYFSVELVGGEPITYPAASPSTDPVQVSSVDREEQTAEISSQTKGIAYTILSPEPGSQLPPNDVVVAITVFYEEGVVDTSTSSFKLTVDGKDVTGQAEATGYFFIHVPDSIAPGEHHAALMLETPDEILEVASWSFEVLDSFQAAAAEYDFDYGFGEGGASGFIPTGQAELTAQNRQIGGSDTDVLRGNVRLSGREGDIRYTAYGLLTSEESNRLQPQNRYSAEVYVGEWFELHAGHIYPSLSRLSLSGRRVQGVNTAVHLLDGKINAQFLFGKINRRISNLYENVVAEEILQPDGEPIDTTYSLGFQPDGVGTFRRNLIGARLGFGNERKLQWGLNFLKVRDDTTTLTSISSYTELINTQPSLLDGLDAAHIAELESNPDLLAISGNPQPKDNLIAGTDLALNLLDDRLQFRSETSISLLNNNITGGILGPGNNLGVDVDEDITNTLDKWSWLIIINENMSTLPFRFRVDAEADRTELDPFFPTGILANQSELNLNLYENNFRLQYRWIGPDYVSLANSTVRRDVAGFTVTDRFQLLQNRLYITLGYENLNDNVIGTGNATTDTNTMRTNVSWFPIDQFLPRVSFGFMYRRRDNSVPLFNPYVSDDLAQAAVRNFAVVEGDTTITASPKLTDTIQFTTSVSQEFNLFDLTHDASLNFSLLSTKDDFFVYGDTKNSSLNFTINSRIPSVPMNTKIGLNINNTETLGGLSDINIFGLNVGGSMFLLDDKLNVTADIAYTSNTTDSKLLAIDDNGTTNPLDDFFRPDTDDVGEVVSEASKNKLFIFRAGAQYDLTPNHAFMVDISFTNVSDQLSNINPPNDHLLEARYIFRF